jgi:hypothetical protein
MQFQSGNVMPLFLFFDCLIASTFLGVSKFMTMKVMGLFVALLPVYGVLTGVAVYWASKTFITMARAVISLLLALGSIAFLVSMTPIFVSFALFQSTLHLFDNWLRYIISYCLQMVFTFGVMVMWILVFIKFLGFFAMLADLIFAYPPAIEEPGIITPTATWGICPVVYDFTTTGAPVAFCADPEFNPDKKTNRFGWRQDYTDMVAPEAIIRDGKFLYFVFYHLIALIIITYAFGVVLEQVPSLAQAVSSSAELPTPLAHGLGKLNFGKATGDLSDEMKGGPAEEARNNARGATGVRRN